MKRLAAVLGALALAAVGATGIQAAPATGFIRFIDLTGTISPTDGIPLFVELVMAQNSSVLEIDTQGANGNLIQGGFSNAELSALGFDLNAPISQNIRFEFFCSNNYACGSYGIIREPFFQPPLTNLTLTGGNAIILFPGTLVPLGGPTAPGTYGFDVQLFISARQFDPASGALKNHEVSNFTQYCFEADCTLRRTVQAPVPEPATWALMIGGFGLAGTALRRGRALAA